MIRWAIFPNISNWVFVATASIFPRFLKSEIFPSIFYRQQRWICKWPVAPFVPTHQIDSHFNQFIIGINKIYFSFFTLSAFLIPMGCSLIDTLSLQLFFMACARKLKICNSGCISIRLNTPKWYFSFNGQKQLCHFDSRSFPVQ